MLDLEYKSVFETQNSYNYDEEGQHKYYKLSIENNQEMQSGMFFTYRKKCEFCDRDHKENCDFQFPSGCLTFEDMLNKMNPRRPLVLVVNWRTNPPAKIEMIEKPTVKNISDDSLVIANPTSNTKLTLYDCLNSFMVEENLTGNDKWYCGKCKDHVVASKKMEVYRCPEILIIHFKRFSHNRSSTFSSKKLTDKIDFPIDGLNMS